VFYFYFKAYPDSFAFSVSHTTREPREGIPSTSWFLHALLSAKEMIDPPHLHSFSQLEGEIDGVHYHFVGLDKMKEDIANGARVFHHDSATIFRYGLKMVFLHLLGIFIESAQVHTNFYGTR
jgi:guanylate kinase